MAGTFHKDGSYEYHELLTGAALTIASFESALGTPGGWLVCIGIALFAFSTILGWEYHGEKAFENILPKADDIFDVIDEEEAFERRSICGYCDGYTKQIVICDMTTYEGWEHESPETAKAAQNATLRHEIVHAFLNESGLMDSCFAYDGSWARCEEMVDWIALQTPKMIKAFEETGCL